MASLCLSLGTLASAQVTPPLLQPAGAFISRDGRYVVGEEMVGNFSDRRTTIDDLVTHGQERLQVTVDYGGGDATDGLSPKDLAEQRHQSEVSQAGDVKAGRERLAEFKKAHPLAAFGDPGRRPPDGTTDLVITATGCAGAAWSTRKETPLAGGAERDFPVFDASTCQAGRLDVTLARGALSWPWLKVDLAAAPAPILRFRWTDDGQWASVEGGTLSGIAPAVPRLELLAAGAEPAAFEAALATVEKAGYRVAKKSKARTPRTDSELFYAPGFDARAAELAKLLSIAPDHIKPLEWTATGAIVIALAAAK